MNPYRCYACTQHDPLLFDGLTFYGAEPKCPKCGHGPPAVIALTPVHYLVPDLNGPIAGLLGRFHVACEPQRPHLALPGVRPRYSASGEPSAVTCYKCLKVAKIERELVVA